MHEFPITQQIIKLAEERAAGLRAVRVKSIKLVVGDSSGFVGDSIQMYFDAISEGTLCEGARIEIGRVKAKMSCTGCGELFERKFLSFVCPKCGAQGAPTEIGREFYIESIEVER
jgi:hydrogenase nickel incorporation protein HypA/HybF